jgi:membrane protease YdiL (CAAX protease family)
MVGLFLLIMNKLSRYFNQPYPKSNQNWLTVFIISFFVFLFLVLYKPFGLNSADQNIILLVSSYFAGVTFIVLFIHLILIEAFFKKAFEEEKWTIGKELLWLLWILIAIALANALFDLIYNSNWNVTFSLVFSYLKIYIGCVVISYNCDDSNKTATAFLKNIKM